MANPRKPRALKVLSGTVRRDRDRLEPAFPETSGANRPNWVSDDDAVAEWDRLVGLLETTRVLTEADLTALGHLCNMHSAAVKLYRKGEEPTAAQLTQLRLMLGEFGLTPSSRSKAQPAGNGRARNPFQALA